MIVFRLYHKEKEPRFWAGFLKCSDTCRSYGATSCASRSMSPRYSPRMEDGPDVSSTRGAIGVRLLKFSTTHAPSPSVTSRRIRAVDSSDSNFALVSK